MQKPGGAFHQFTVKQLQKLVMQATKSGNRKNPRSQKQRQDSGPKR